MVSAVLILRIMCSPLEIIKYCNILIQGHCLRGFMNNRRSFFKKITTLSLFLGVGSKLNATEQLLSSENIKSNEFPVTVATKYFFPADKTPMDVKQDMDSWGNLKKHAEIYKKLVAEKKVSLKMHSVYKDDHLESKMYFKDIASYNEYKDFLADNQTVNRDKQKELGYRVIVEVT